MVAHRRRGKASVVRGWWWPEEIKTEEGELWCENMEALRGVFGAFFRRSRGDSGEFFFE